MNLCTRSLLDGLKWLAFWIKTFNPTWKSNANDGAKLHVEFIRKKPLKENKLQKQSDWYKSDRNCLNIHYSISDSSHSRAVACSWRLRAVCEHTTVPLQPPALPSPAGGRHQSRHLIGELLPPSTLSFRPPDTPGVFFLCLLLLSSLRATAGKAPSGTSNWLILSPMSTPRAVSGRCVNMYCTLLTSESLMTEKKKRFQW